MKRVLIITYYWPPSGGSGVQRWLKFSKYLPENGWQPVIYTPSNPEIALEDPTLSKEIPPEAEVVKRRILEPYSLFKAFASGRKKDGSASSATAVNPINAVGKKSLGMRLSLWIRANIFVPDPRCLWIGLSVRFLKKYLQEHPVDAIVSTGPPQSMHLIALRLHKATGIKWLADFRDPWTKIFYFKHLPMLGCIRRKHSRLERAVLQNADAVVSVTDLITRQLEAIATADKLSAQPVTVQHYDDSPRHSGGQLPTRFHTIENGYDEEDFQADVKPDTHFVLTHTGVFSAEGNPEMLWKVLGDLCKENPDFKADLRIVLAGKTDGEILNDMAAAGLSDSIINHGYVKHSESNTLQQKARVLLLPLRKEPEADGILTGKYFEYLAADRPIVAFGPKGGALDLSLQKTGAGKIFEWEEYEALKACLLDLYADYKTTNSVTDPTQASAPKFLNPDQTHDHNNSHSDQTHDHNNSHPDPTVPSSATSSQAISTNNPTQADIARRAQCTKEFRTPDTPASTSSFHPDREEIAKYSRRSLASRMATLLSSM